MVIIKLTYILSINGWYSPETKNLELDDGDID